MKKLTLSDYQALAEFRYQIRRFLHFSEQVVKNAGLKRGQYQLMLAIKGMPPGVRPRIRELANRMQIRHHSAVELVNRLETGGFVHRTRAEDDRRAVALVPLSEGPRDISLEPAGSARVRLHQIKPKPHTLVRADALPAITIPALVLVGARDTDYLGAAEYMAARLPRAAHAAIPDAGHVCNVDQPDLFSRQVLAFLDQPDLR